LLPEKRRVSLTTICRVLNKVVIEGDAVVMPTSRQTARPEGGSDSSEDRTLANAIAA
jgi:3-hydroxybutyryl-CoA dehydratase